MRIRGVGWLSVLRGAIFLILLRSLMVDGDEDPGGGGGGGGGGGESGARRKRGKGIDWVDLSDSGSDEDGDEHEEDDDDDTVTCDPTNKKWRKRFTERRRVKCLSHKGAVVSYGCPQPDCSFIMRHKQDPVSGTWALQVRENE